MNDIQTIPSTTAPYRRDDPIWRSGLGGSEIAAAAGLSAFKSPYELYLEKRGELPPKDISGEPQIIFGQLFEDPIARGYCMIRGQREGREVKVERRNDAIWHRQIKWMFGHIDRKVVGERRGLEVKNVGAFSRPQEWGADGSDNVPDEVVMQCQQYLAVTDYEAWDVAALFGGNDLRIFTIHRDARLITDLIDVGTEFMERVTEGQPPEPEWQAHSTHELIKRLHPGTDGSTIEADAELQKWHETRMEAMSLENKYKGVAEGARNHLMMAMGGATFLRMPDGSGYRRKLIQRKGYVVSDSQYLDFRYSKRVKGGGDE